VDYFQTQKAKEADRQAGVQVLVEQKTEVYTEELWREAVQVLLYGSPAVEISSSVSD